MNRTKSYGRPTRKVIAVNGFATANWAIVSADNVALTAEMSALSIIVSAASKDAERQRNVGALAALKPQRRGRKPQTVSPLTADNERLRRENERLTARLKQAETIIDVQKKIREERGSDSVRLQEGTDRCRNKE